MAGLVAEWAVTEEMMIEEEGAEISVIIKWAGAPQSRQSYRA